MGIDRPIVGGEKRVLFLTPAYAPLPGGGERYVAAVARELARRGYRLTVVTSAATGEAEFWQGSGQTTITESTEEEVRVVRLPLRRFPGGRSGLFVWRKLMVMVSALPGDQSAILGRMARGIPTIQHLQVAVERLGEEFDLVHAFNVSWEYPLVVAANYARRHHLPLVVTPFAHLGTNERGRVARNSTMDHQLRILREAGCVLTLTVAEREGLARLGIPKEQLVVVGSGVDDAPADDPESAALAAVRQRFPHPYIIFLGRASYDKGALHAAEAVLVLRQQGVKVGLVVIGQTTPEFQQMMNGLPEEERNAIYEAGVVSDVDKHVLLRRAAMLLLPSRVDSFGIVMLEAWSHRIPVVAARAGGITAVVDDNKNGLLVPFGEVRELMEAIYRLLTNEAERRAIGERGWEKVQSQYTWDRVVDQVVERYKRLATERLGDWETG